jgi:hypothetical protein
MKLRSFGRECENGATINYHLAQRLLKGVLKGEIKRFPIMASLRFLPVCNLQAISIFYGV